MKIFCIGDIMGREGRGMVRGHLEDLIYSKGIDLVAANIIGQPVQCDIGREYSANIPFRIPYGY